MGKQYFKCIGSMRGHSKKNDKDYTIIHYLCPMPKGGNGFTGDGFQGKSQYFEGLTAYDVVVGEYFEFVTGINDYGNPAVTGIVGLGIEDLEDLQIGA